jgi:uncharacterized beta-barrel protein YwiB (DUF1934 family)
MKACKVTIITNTDGQENTVVRDGYMELSLSKVSITYQEENAVVSLRLQEENAEIERKGDYSLHLKLKRGKLEDGQIGLGGSCGKIQTLAHRIQCSVTKDSVLAALRYDLLFGEEKQEMQLRLLSRFTK